MSPNAAFSFTKCASPTIAIMGTICILLICLTTQMNLSIHSARPSRSLRFIGITTTDFLPWEHNTHCWVFLHRLEKVNIAFLASRHFRHWSIWFNGVQLKYNIGTKGICPWKVLLRLFSSLCIYWTQMLWASGKIPWLAFIYSTLQSSPKCSPEVGLLNRWW